MDYGLWTMDYGLWTVSWVSRGDIDINNDVVFNTELMATYQPHRHS